MMDQVVSGGLYQTLKFPDAQKTCLRERRMALRKSALGGLCLGYLGSFSFLGLLVWPWHQGHSGKKPFFSGTENVLQQHHVWRPKRRGRHCYYC